MKIKKIHNRGILLIFDELNSPPFNCTTNVYVIVGNDKYYICDTYLGPCYMKQIKQYLESNHGSKEYIVFNSHFHWDHIWGNSEFADSRIIASEKTREFMLRYAKEDLETYKPTFAKENIMIVLPNDVFKNKISFEEDNLLFFYSPGHTEDSSSCFDYEDKTLFAGDNIDDPIPSFLEWNDLKKYKETLENYLLYEPERVIQSHGDVISSDVISNNIKYLDDLIEGRELNFESEEVNKKHQNNLKFLGEKNEKI